MPCGEDRDDTQFVEELTFADAEAILAMLHSCVPTSLTVFSPYGYATWPTGLRFSSVLKIPH